MTRAGEEISDLANLLGNSGVQAVVAGRAASLALITDPAAPPLPIGTPIELLVNSDDLTRFSADCQRRGFHTDCSPAARPPIDPMPQRAVHGSGLTIEMVDADTALHGLPFDYIELTGNCCLRVLAPPVSLARELRYAADRNLLDQQFDPRFEAVVALMNGRDHLITEVAHAPAVVQRVIEVAVDQLLANPDSLERALGRHLPQDDANQARAGMIVLPRLARLGSAHGGRRSGGLGAVVDRAIEQSAARPGATPSTEAVYFSDKLELVFRTTHGIEFQSFFEHLMNLRYGGRFTTVRSQGRDGDAKCDGLLDTDTVFQVYAPLGPKPDRYAIKKVREDLEGALNAWPALRRWIFVYNAPDGVGPKLLKELEGQRAENPHVEIHLWTNEMLREIVDGLPRDNKVVLLGRPPSDFNLQAAVTDVLRVAFETDPGRVPRHGQGSRPHRKGNMRVIDGLLEEYGDSAKPFQLMVGIRTGDQSRLRDEILRWLRDRGADSDPSQTALAAELLYWAGDRQNAAREYERAASHARSAIESAQLLARASDLVRPMSEAAADDLLAQARNAAPDVDRIQLEHLAKLAEIDPDAALLELERFHEPSDPMDLARRSLLRGQVQLRLGRYAEARELAQQLLDRYPWHLGVLDFWSSTALVTTPTDRQALVRAREMFEVLRETYASIGALPAVEGRMVYKALGACLALQDQEGARRYLNSQLLDALVAEDGAVALDVAHWANMLDEPERALAILSRAPSSADRDLATAVAKLRSGSPEDRSAALQELESVVELAADPLVRERAAIERLLAAAVGTVDTWHDQAADILVRKHDALATTLEARWHMRLERYREAERVLLSATPSAGVLEALLDLANRSGDKRKALHLAHRLRALEPTPQNVFLHARCLAEVGRSEEAIDTALEIGLDGSVGIEQRERAFRFAAQVALDSGEPHRGIEIAKAWHSALSDETAGWLEVRSLLMLDRYKEASARLTALGPPKEPWEASMAVKAFEESLAPQEALAKIVALGERFLDNETVSAQIVLAAVTPRLQVPVPESLEKRLRALVQGFPARFPGSQILRTVTAVEPDTLPAEVLSNLRERHELGSKITKAIARGEMPVAAVGEFLGGEETLTWIRTAPLPFATGNSQEHLAEVKIAASSLGGGAVWDVSAVVTAAGCLEVLGNPLSSSIPVSTIPLPCRADLMSSLPQLREPETARYMLTLDRGNLAALPRTAAQALEEARLADHIFGVCNQLEVSGHSAVAGRGVPSTTNAVLEVAIRRGLPVYSDDRAVRHRAQQQGSGAFGTTALLEALVQRGVIMSTERNAVRRQMLMRGGEGLCPSADELLSTLDPEDWGPSLAIISTFGSVLTWMQSPSDLMRLELELLQLASQKGADLKSHLAAFAVAANRASGGIGETLACTLVALAVGTRSELAAPLLSVVADALQCPTAIQQVANIMVETVRDDHEMSDLLEVIDGLPKPLRSEVSAAIRAAW